MKIVMPEFFFGPCMSHIMQGNFHIFQEIEYLIYRAHSNLHVQVTFCYLCKLSVMRMKRIIEEDEYEKFHDFPGKCAYEAIFGGR